MSFPFFVEMAWKSALIAGAALLLAALLRSRSAADRAALLKVAIGLLLALPMISLLLPALQIELAPGVPEAQPDAFGLLAMPQADAVATGLMPSTMTAAAYAPTVAEAPAIWGDPGLLVALIYLGGLAMAGIRLGAGLLTLRRWTAEAQPVSCPIWNGALARVRGAAGAGELRLLVSADAPSPLSWGWRRPVVLIDPDSLERPEDAEAILAHEVAHVIRRDWAALMLSRVAAALFWFNPLVWLLEREFVQSAEEAADCHAAAQVEPTRYAETLLCCVQHGRHGPVPANSIASTGLSRRVKAVLNGRTGTPSGSAWTAGAIVATMAFAAPLAALEISEAKRSEAAAAEPMAAAAAAAAPVGEALPQPAAAQAPDAPSSPAAAALPAQPAPPEGRFDDIGPAVEAALASTLPQIPAIVASATSRIDPEEIGRIAAKATREAHAAQIEARVEARAAARAAADHASVAAIAAARDAAKGRAHGAAGMEQGAKGMEAGARQMKDEARKLRNRDYREQQIARAAARGERVTHEELLEAADGLEEGSREMIEGAREMRSAAVEMRRHGLH